jgi:hypothetical protein
VEQYSQSTEKKNLSTKKLYPTKLFFRNEGEIDMYLQTKQNNWQLACAQKQPVLLIPNHMLIDQLCSITALLILGWKILILTFYSKLKVELYL